MKRSPCAGLIVLSLVFAIAGSASAQTGAPPPSPPAEAQHVCESFGVSTVFRCIGFDLRSATKGSSLVWLGSGALLAGGSLLLDDEVLQTIWDGDPDASLAAGERLGHAGLHFGAPLLVYGVARATGHRELADFGIALFRTHIVNGALTRGLKLLPRPRPYQEVATPTKGSFPSGHTSAMFATATVIQRRWGWRAGLPAYMVSGYVGATRLQNKHYLSDVAFGAALGLASGLAVPLPGDRLRISPMAAPGTAGVQVAVELPASSGR